MEIYGKRKRIQTKQMIALWPTAGYREILITVVRDPSRKTPDQAFFSTDLDCKPEDLLVKSDRCSMAHGLELRSPFLDTALMEYTASLPDRCKIRGRHMKVALKGAFRDMLPEPIHSRGKMGFGVPLPTWFRNQWRPLLEDRVLADDARIWEWIRPEPVRAMARDHLEGRADFGHQLWALLTLEEWLRGR